MVTCWRAAYAIVSAALLSACQGQDAPKAADAAPASPARYAALDTLPDWSGVWALSEESMNTGAMVDSGLAAFTGVKQTAPVPFKPKYMAVWSAATKTDPNRLDGFVYAGNAVSCLPDGMPGLMQHPMLTEYLFTPGRVTVMFQNGEVRRIFTDGRAHRAADELEYGSEGDSIGHWENAVLVVDTIGISERADLLLNNEVRTTRKTHVAERIFLKDKDRLQIDTVVTDPDLFTGPYAYSRIYQRSPLPFTDTGCAANNRDNDAAVDLTPPPPRQEDNQ